MEINKTLRLPASQYYQDVVQKKSIYLHHTVGGSALSTFNWWKQTTARIGTAYIIARDGTIFEVFEPYYWAHHLGTRNNQNRYFNQSSVGIELASEGALRSGQELNNILGEDKFDWNYLYAFDIDQPPFPRAKKLYHLWYDQDKYIDIPVRFRGYGFFDLYEEPQIVSAIELVNHLCDKFQIPKQLLPHDKRFEYDENYLNHNGVLTHCNVRVDKSDLSPAWAWHRLESSFNG